MKYSSLCFYLMCLIATAFSSCLQEEAKPVVPRIFPLPSALSAAAFQEYNQQLESVPNNVFIWSEGTLTGTDNVGYRIQGNILPETYPGVTIDEIRIGELSLPVDPQGTLHKGFGRLVNGEEYRYLRSLGHRQQTLQLLASGSVIDQIEVDIEEPLRASASQNNVDPVLTDVLNKGEDLILSWPVTDEGLTFRDGSEESVHMVGAAVAYKPLSSNRNNVTGASFPDRDFSIWDYANYADGQIVFSADDLKDFPDQSIVTIYIGSVRYRVDAEGNLMVSSTGQTSVTSGGTQAGVLIRVHDR